MIRVVRLGSTRLHGEGLRIGTVRFPPRGVPKAEVAKRGFYDVWFPILSPSAATIKRGTGADTEATWKAFERAYRKEMGAPEACRALELLAALSHQASFSVGCYCENEARCHRSILRALLLEAGADVAPAD